MRKVAIRVDTIMCAVGFDAVVNKNGPMNLLPFSGYESRIHIAVGMS